MYGIPVLGQILYGKHMKRDTEAEQKMCYALYELCLQGHLKMKLYGELNDKEELLPESSHENSR